METGRSIQEHESIAAFFQKRARTVSPEKEPPTPNTHQPLNQIVEPLTEQYR